MTRWHEATGGADGADYASRFAELAASGADVHGEADFCAALVPLGASVLDAGCGTGRVTIELVRRGYRCVGVDVDASMLRQARLAAPDGAWMEADLATLDLPDQFDLVVAAGNVIPLLAAGTEAETIRRLADHLLRPGGLLVTGFGLDAEHLPLPDAPFGVSAYDAWCASAGLQLVDRFATWQRDRFDDGGY
ncbi:MAG: class I SAM-dependent methyltransferase, partial [Nocardioidaceae bacterium]